MPWEMKVHRLRGRSFYSTLHGSRDGIEFLDEETHARPTMPSPVGTQPDLRPRIYPSQAKRSAPNEDTAQYTTLSYLSAFETRGHQTSSRPAKQYTLPPSNHGSRKGTRSKHVRLLLSCDTYFVHLGHHALCIM